MGQVLPPSFQKELADILILYFWPLGLVENEFPLFLAPWCVAICPTALGNEYTCVHIT